MASMPVSRRLLLTPFVTEINRERPKPIHRTPGIFPGIRVIADVEESNGRVGDDFESGLPRAMAKREILVQIPISVAVGHDHGKKVGHDRFAETLIAKP